MVFFQPYRAQAGGCSTPLRWRRRLAAEGCVLSGLSGAAAPGPPLPPSMRRKRPSTWQAPPDSSAVLCPAPRPRCRASASASCSWWRLFVADGQEQRWRVGGSEEHGEAGVLHKQGRSGCSMIFEVQKGGGTASDHPAVFLHFLGENAHLG